MYSTISNPPFSCLRTVNGSLSAEVIGWFAKPVLIIFLMPMTILNLASLIIILITRSRAKGGCHEFDPTDLRPLILAEPSLDEEEPSGWADRVTYRSREVCECHVSVHFSADWRGSSSRLRKRSLNKCKLQSGATMTASHIPSHTIQRRSVLLSSRWKFHLYCESVN